MTAEQAAVLDARFAESSTEWRRLGDARALDAFLAEAGIPPGETPASLLREDGRGFTLADALVVETGTVVQSTCDPAARRAAFLAETHFALVAEESVHDTLAGWLDAAGDWRGRAGWALTLITGPSRTADIEKILVLGAHGPKRLVVAACPASLRASRFPDRIR
jgi:L-lactate dehydrogenase complex protein LldG